MTKWTIIKYIFLTIVFIGIILGGIELYEGYIETQEDLRKTIIAERTNIEEEKGLEEGLKIIKEQNQKQALIEQEIKKAAWIKKQEPNWYYVGGIVVGTAIIVGVDIVMTGGALAGGFLGIGAGLIGESFFWINTTTVGKEKLPWGLYVPAWLDLRKWASPNISIFFGLGEEQFDSDIQRYLQGRESSLPGPIGTGIRVMQPPPTMGMLVELAKTEGVNDCEVKVGIGEGLLKKYKKEEKDEE